MSASDAKDESTRLMKLASGPNATVGQKRDFYSSLFELAKYPDVKAKIQAGMFITSYFAEFPDLQEEAIDLVYDLCEDEDEKVRIQGIKSLAAVSEKDVAWLSRNTGVLLQLLACSANELTFVHKALCDLIAKSPAEVFHAMAQDTIVPPGEPTQQRSLVLDFVFKHAVAARQTFLESGNYPEAERVFSTGLLQGLETTNEQETQVIASLLLALPHLADTETSTTPLLRYLCNLTSPSPFQIDSFAKLTVNKPCDPRYPLLFLARHGSAVCTLGDRCIALWKGVRVWQDKALEMWQTTSEDVAMDGESQVDETSKHKLVPQVIETFVNIASKQTRLGPRPPPPVGTLIEILLHAVYRFRQATPEHSSISSQQRNAITNVERWASQVSRNERNLESQRIWSSAAALASALSIGDDSTLPQLTPSWIAQSARPREIRHAPTGPRSSLEASGSRQPNQASSSRTPSLLQRVGGVNVSTPSRPTGQQPARPTELIEPTSAGKRKFEEPVRVTPASELSVRGRATPPVSSGTKPSLLSRMDSSSAPTTPADDRQGKRSRGSPQISGLPARPSLLDRLSQSSGSPALATPLPIKPTPSFSAAPRVSDAALSIKGRSMDSVPAQRAPLRDTRPDDVRLEITKPVTDNDEGIIRKGRGFAKSAPEIQGPPDLLLVRPSPPKQPASMSFRGAAGGRGGTAIGGNENGARQQGPPTGPSGSRRREGGANWGGRY